MPASVFLVAIPTTATITVVGVIATGDVTAANVTASAGVTAATYTVGATAGADFSGAVTNLTAVKGLVTAAS